MNKQPNESIYPANWLFGKDFDPADHLMKIDRYDRITQRKTANEYMNVQNRLLWFIRDQRAIIASGAAKGSYEIKTELIELDRQVGWAHFKTYIRDTLGNEAVMYGSESARDFPDFIEKASTKSLGRALLLLGYGTAFANEMDEEDRFVDSPQTAAKEQPEPYKAGAAQPKVNTVSILHEPAADFTKTPDLMATDRQKTSIQKICAKLGQPEPDINSMSFDAARNTLAQLSVQLHQKRTLAAV